MVFFSSGNSAIPTFTYDGTPLELVTEFKYLEFSLTRDGSMLTDAEKMANNLRSAIARIYRFGDSKGIKHRKHAMLWFFQVFALTAGLYGFQVCMGHFFSDI
jgi:chromosome condensin MukBEF MukE localization factor